MEGSYILRPIRVVTRVRRWRLAAGEGRESRRVVAEAARSDLHILTHTYMHLRTRVSVTAGAVTHGPVCTRGARGRRTSRRKGGEGPRGLVSGRACLIRPPLCWVVELGIGSTRPATRTHMYTPGWRLPGLTTSDQNLHDRILHDVTSDRIDSGPGCGLRTSWPA